MDKASLAGLYTIMTTDSRGQLANPSPHFTLTGFLGGLSRRYENEGYSFGRSPRQYPNRAETHQP